MSKEAAPNRADALPPETTLWRYMDLGKLMVLLHRHRAFIPTLETLRGALDPKEAFLPWDSVDYLPDLFFDDCSPAARKMRDWLAHSGEKGPAGGNRHTELRPTPVPENGLDKTDAYDKWIAELSRRRAIWCWASPKDLQGRTYESLAMWNSYARSGVAVKTTLDCVEAAIKDSPQLQGLERTVIPVMYRQQVLPTKDLMQGGLLRRPFRPYAYKTQSYAYESEVRIVFRINGRGEGEGVNVKIDPVRLLEGGKVLVSPYLPAPEASELVEAIKATLPECANIEVEHSSERQTAAEMRRHMYKQIEIRARGAQPSDDEDDIPELLMEL